MEGFKFSPDCAIEKSARAVTNELLKGSFVIGCDYKNSQLILENVFHYTESQKRLEVYTLFPDETNTKRQLKLETAFILLSNSDIKEEIANILQMGIDDYDLFVIDRHNNLYTKVVYDKYGESMRLA